MASDFQRLVLAQAAERLLELRLAKTFRVATPAAGSDWTQTVPGGVTWELLAATFTLTTSAVVANRTTFLEIRNPDGVNVHRWPVPAVVAASTTVRTTFGVGQGYTLSLTDFTAGLPAIPIPLPPGSIVRTTTTNIDVADAYTAIFLTVREWSETDVLQEMMELYDQLDSLYQPEVTG